MILTLHSWDNVLFVAAIMTVVLSYAQRFFIDGSVMGREVNFSPFFGSIWFPSKYLTPFGKKLRMVRDICLIVSLVITVVLTVSRR